MDIPPSYACPICSCSDSASLWALDYHLRAMHQATIQTKPASITIDSASQLRLHGFQYDPRHSLLICSKAGEGVPQCDVQTHLTKCSHQVTDALQTLLKGTTFADVDDPLPLEMGAPIPGIYVEHGFRCGECSLAFTAPQTQPKKKINKHIKERHSAERDVKSHLCSIQRWFGGDSNYRANSDPALEQWRYVIVDPNATDTKLASTSLVNQLELFDKIIPPLPAHPESADVIDRRELGAVIHRLNLVTFASAEVMRSHHALCHTRHSTGLQDFDLFSLCKDWIQSVQRATVTLPDQVRCWLATLR
jgi:hypothetical protein